MSAVASDGQTWALVVNPVAGGGRGPGEWAAIGGILDRHGIRHQTIFTESPGHAMDLTRHLVERGARRFLVGGGDGLLNEVVNGLFTQSAIDPGAVTLACLPRGTGNDWSRTFGLPVDPAAAAAVIASGRTFEQTIGRVIYHEDGVERSRFFLNLCGVGFDAAVSRRLASNRAAGPVGPLKYQYHLLAALAGYHPTRMTVRLDGREICEQVLSLAVGIGRYNGGGMKQLPHAVPGGGLLALTVIRPVSWLRAVRVLPRLYDGSFVGLPEITTATASRVEVDSAPDCAVEADGETLGGGPFRFEIVPRRLRVVIPPDWRS